MHFPETSIENLCRIGYTEDEARFLYLVATHSGYFSTRQYLEFTGAKSGEKSMAFTQKVLGKGTPRPGCSSETAAYTTSSLAWCIAPLPARISAIGASIPPSISASSWLFWTSF